MKQKISYRYIDNVVDMNFFDYIFREIWFHGKNLDTYFAFSFFHESKKNQVVMI